MTVLCVAAVASMFVEVPACAQTTEPTVEDLQKQLRQRDALIQSLARRVEKLERQMATGVPAATRAIAKSRAGSHPIAPTEVALHPEEKSTGADDRTGSARTCRG